MYSDHICIQRLNTTYLKGKKMAGTSSNYNRGDMDVKEQSGTFGGFMGLTKYGGAAVVLVVMLPTLIFAVGMSWLSALVATVVLGIVIGIALKFKGMYYVSLIGAAFLTTILCFLISLLAG